MEELIAAVVELDEKKALRLARQMLADGADPMKIVEMSRKGLAEVGERYEKREYYLSGLVISGDIFRKVVRMLQAHLYGADIEGVGSGHTVVLGTPRGDVHDIGKEIVAILLRCSGFTVIDLGVNVEPHEFLAAVKRSDARMVGISALITLAYDPIRETVAAFADAGLREQVKIVLGGGAVSQRVCEYTGADYWSKDATDAVRLAEETHAIAEKS